MEEPEWVDLAVVLAIHEEQLAEHGGSTGLRDSGLLESALARPRNRYACNNATVAELAAGYAMGIAKNHPFIDGNKPPASWSRNCSWRLTESNSPPPMKTASSLGSSWLQVPSPRQRSPDGFSKIAPNAADTDAYFDPR